MPNKKLIKLLFFLLASICLYSQNLLNQEVSLNFAEKPLSFALEEIRKQSNINLIYNTDFNSDKLISYNISLDAEKAISKVLETYNLSYKKYDDNSIVIYRDPLKTRKLNAVVKESRVIEKKSDKPTPIVKPTLLSKINLQYPILAKDKKLEGEVLLNLLVNSKGNVARVNIEKSSGHEVLDSATLSYVQKLKFLPAEAEGRYISIWTNLLVKYNFEE